MPSITPIVFHNFIVIPTIAEQIRPFVQFVFDALSGHRREDHEHLKGTTNYLELTNLVPLASILGFIEFNFVCIA